jgi:hypothetical protein
MTKVRGTEGEFWLRLHCKEELNGLQPQVKQLLKAVQYADDMMVEKLCEVISELDDISTVSAMVVRVKGLSLSRAFMMSKWIAKLPKKCLSGHVELEVRGVDPYCDGFVRRIGNIE